MNAKLTSFLMTAGAVVVGMYAYKAIAGEAEPVWFKDFRDVNFPAPEMAGRRMKRRR